LVDLGPGQKPIVMSHYPHMMAEDTLVWTKFLSSQLNHIKEVWYDVRVGQPVFVGVNGSNVERRVAAGLTRKRIDAVCRVGGGFWVVEVKPYANMHAVGQVVSYVRLFAQEYSAPGQIIPVIVCDDFDLDLLDEFDELGVLVIRND